MTYTAIVRNIAPLILPLTTVSILLAFVLFRSLQKESDLKSSVLHRGRIVLSSGDIHFGPDSFAGDADNIFDGDLNSPALLRHPSGNPEGTYLLADLALTHWPGRKGDVPRIRKTRGLVIYNGPCHDCSRSVFTRYSRIKKARIEILYRRANDPDREFIIPPAHIVYTKEIELRDTDTPAFIELPVPTPPHSNYYPENVSYIIGKIIVEQVFPGEVYPGIISVAEIKYIDDPVSSSGYLQLPQACAFLLPMI